MARPRPQLHHATCRGPVAITLASVLVFVFARARALGPCCAASPLHPRVAASFCRPLSLSLPLAAPVAVCASASALCLFLFLRERAPCVAVCASASALHGGLTRAWACLIPAVTGSLNLITLTRVFLPPARPRPHRTVPASLWQRACGARPSQQSLGAIVSYALLLLLRQPHAAGPVAAA